MTTEEKQLLLKDLCARLPYGVKVQITLDVGMMEVSYDMTLDLELLNDLIENGDDFKPYLRPKISMTDWEKKEYVNTSLFIDNRLVESLVTYDFLNKYHFDYRGLIENGLALEAPEEMYEKGGKT